jgi:hypothetical protein
MSCKSAKNRHFFQFFCTAGKFEWLEVQKEKLLQKRNLQQFEKAVFNWHRSFFA